jgi:hypothetical protein
MPQSTIKSILKKVKADDAFQFYKKFICNDEKLELLEKHGFPKTGSVPSTDWELFASILVNENASEGYGADLETFEVKSAKIGSSFEYQYHKFTGEEKLQEDMVVNHLFISYSEGYSEICVRVLLPNQIKETFKKWEEALKENYSEGSKKQRFRKSISFGFVRDNGTIIFHIKDGKLNKTKN